MPHAKSREHVPLSKILITHIEPFSGHLWTELLFYDWSISGGFLRVILFKNSHIFNLVT